MDVRELWNKLATRFNTFVSNEDIHPDAAVNEAVGWPEFFHIIDRHSQYLGKKHLKILDFGCGYGKLAQKLNQLGHRVTGMDISDGMLYGAHKNVDKKVRLINENEYKELLKEESNTFDAVIGMHSFDWIKDIEKEIKQLDKLLTKKGLILFSVFPKGHIIDSLRIKDLFEDFDDPLDPFEGFANFDGIKVPVFVRDNIFYDRYMANLGYSKLIESYPPYPRDFLINYNWSASMFPEMMICGYVKGSHV